MRRIVRPKPALLPAALTLAKPFSESGKPSATAAGPGRFPARGSRRKKRVRFKHLLAAYADELNTAVPASEAWFWMRWEQHGMMDPDELRNSPFANTIPDVRNKPARYIIEIDGSIHARADIQEKDRKKTKAWEALGYRVFRLKAYDENGLESLTRSVKCLKKRSRTH